MTLPSDENYLIKPEELGSILHPFFNTRVGIKMGELLLGFLRVNQLNKIHSDHCHLEKWKMTSAILADPRVNVRYEIHGAEHLEKMKNIGAFHTISNHPFGGLDGLMLIDIVSRVRSDFRVLVNGFLTRITGLSDIWIPVKPRVNKKDYVHDPMANISGLRMVAELIAAGHPVGMFPAGGVPHYDKTLKRPIEQEWQMNNIRIIKQSMVPVFPIAFAGDNTGMYFKLGEKFNYQVAALRLPKELLSKKGKVLNVYVGKPIMPEEIESYSDLKSLRKFLRSYTLGLLPQYQSII